MLLIKQNNNNIKNYHPYLIHFHHYCIHKWRVFASHLFHQAVQYNIPFDTTSRVVRDQLVQQQNVYLALQHVIYLVYSIVEMNHTFPQLWLTLATFVSLLWLFIPLINIWRSPFKRSFFMLFLILVFTGFTVPVPRSGQAFVTGIINTVFGNFTMKV